MKLSVIVISALQPSVVLIPERQLVGAPWFFSLCLVDGEIDYSFSSDSAQLHRCVVEGRSLL